MSINVVSFVVICAEKTILSSRMSGRIPRSAVWPEGGKIPTLGRQQLSVRKKGKGKVFLLQALGDPKG